jgi:hypothetical protein
LLYWLDLEQMAFRQSAGLSEYQGDQPTYQKVKGCA